MAEFEFDYFFLFLNIYSNFLKRFRREIREEQKYDNERLDKIEKKILKLFKRREEQITSKDQVFIFIDVFQKNFHYLFFLLVKFPLRVILWKNHFTLKVGYIGISLIL